MFDFDDLYSPVSFCDGGGGGGGGGGNDCGPNNIGITASAVSQGADNSLGYNSCGYNPQDAQGAYGRPDFNSGGAYSGSTTYGGPDGR